MIAVHTVTAASLGMSGPRHNALTALSRWRNATARWGCIRYPSKSRALRGPAACAVRRQERLSDADCPGAQDPDLVRLLPEAFELRLGVWLAMHENLRATPRCRAVFDGLA